MGETIIEKECTGDGLPIYSADKSNRPWTFSTHFKRKIKQGSIIIGARGTIGYPRLPVEERFGATQTTIVLTPDIEFYQPEYVHYCLQLVDFNNLGAQQAIPMLTVANLDDVEIPRLTIPEQAKIAEVLSTVDRAIEQTEALIAKQQRIKTGLMQDLLTRGIDEHGNLRSEATHAFKDSPLGRIPVEWEVKELAEIVDLQVGYAFKSSDFVDDGIRLMRGENVGTGRADWKETRYLTIKKAESFDEFSLSSGDLIIGMDRTFTKQGFKVTLISDDDAPCLLVQRVGRFVPVSVSKRFMQLLIQSPRYRRELLSQQKGMDIPHLSKFEILSPLVAIPNTDAEMYSISAEMNKISIVLMQQVGVVIKLRSLKIGLMQDLLTGKKRVTPLLDEEVPA